MSAPLAGLIIIIATLFIYFLCLLPWSKNRFVYRFKNRKKDAALKTQIANSLEASSPVHLDIGNHGDEEMIGVSALIAFDVTGAVASQMSLADEPWLITTNSGAINAFEKDAIARESSRVRAENDSLRNNPIYAGFSAIAHQSTMISVLDGASSALHLSIGPFGSETALQYLAFDAEESLVIGGDNLGSQAVGFISADEVYFGEQLCEIPAVVSKENNPQTAIDLLAMDILRYGLSFGLIAGILIKIFK